MSQSDIITLFSIGFAIAKKLANEGANVVVSSRKEANVNAAVVSLKNYGYQNITGVVCHVGKSEDRKRLYEEVRFCVNFEFYRRAEVLQNLLQAINKFGGIDILVSNAAVNPFFGYTADVSTSLLDKKYSIAKYRIFLFKSVL